VMTAGTAPAASATAAASHATHQLVRAWRGSVVVAKWTSQPPSKSTGHAELSR